MPFSVDKDFLREERKKMIKVMEKANDPRVMPNTPRVLTSLLGTASALAASTSADNLMKKRTYEEMERVNMILKILSSC